MSGTDAPEIVITTGVPDGPVVPRLELRTFLEDGDLTNLYLLALDRMQRTDQDDPTSWFQIAAIHGRPFRPWNGVGDNKLSAEEFVSTGRSGGYCTHSSVLFPSWHRPYLALFEQILSKHVHDIANTFVNPQEKERYQAAAKRFRIPFWDWGVNPQLPSIVATDEIVTVYTPYGSNTIKNPLYSYLFHPIPQDFGDGGPDEEMWETWPATVRYPDAHGMNAKSQSIPMQKELEIKHPITRDKAYILLTQAANYNAFSNDSYKQDQPPISYVNIESIHNDLHGFSGGDGHMGAVDYAAFDPVFWLHHANVDRLFAIWQALHPDEYVAGQANAAGTWTTDPGSEETAETALTPFRFSADKFWDSNGVRHTHTFRYTYPELKRWKKLEAKEKQTNLRSDIIRLYGSPVVERLLDAYYQYDQKVANLPKPVPLARDSSPLGAGEPVFKIDKSDHPDTLAKDTDTLHYHEWLVNVVVRKYEVNASFKVLVFLGKPSPDPNQWDTDPNLVGEQVIFANNVETTGCKKCKDKGAKGQRVTGTIPMSTFLGDRMQEKNLTLDPAFIIPYLENNFTWRVKKLDGSLIKVPSLRISIAHALVEIPEPGSSRTEFPSWKSPVHRADIDVGASLGGGLGANLGITIKGSLNPGLGLGFSSPIRGIKAGLGV